MPKNFDGLFHPQLKGKLGISIGQTSDKIIGAMIKTKGEEFVRKLKAQEMKLYSIDAPALVNTITTGEIAGSPAIFQTHTLMRRVERRAGGMGARWIWSRPTSAAPPSPPIRPIRTGRY